MFCVFVFSSVSKRFLDEKVSFSSPKLKVFAPEGAVEVGEAIFWVFKWDFVSSCEVLNIVFELFSLFSRNLGDQEKKNMKIWFL